MIRVSAPPAAPPKPFTSVPSPKEAVVRRIALGAALFAVFVSASAGTAAADPPNRFDVDASFSGVDTAICGFPIQLTGRVTGFETEFSDRSGQLRQTLSHFTEYLSLSANGQTIVADAIAVNFRSVVGPDGEVENVYLTGLVAKFTLPDGTQFLSAGRFDFAEAGVNFTLTPDVGRSGDVEAFCEALS
jgi:hypothetical protein